ncbi:MAG TPA: hypothetical protein PLJ42_02165 [Chitinophagales bacterium]|jgi:hypothetical protein|nr:hypothetical protein [Chitinophagales bacterium]HRB67140.1 hypothetical protein [Chitinophagales bacterium]HRB69692.1 hypothetical protein [Chitinophagales bacterium]
MSNEVRHPERKSRLFSLKRDGIKKRQPKLTFYSVGEHTNQ